ncbi:MAG: tyrosine--tRNA ligase [Planctomycetes bacterium]|nr:tyrosine--tRNA ligase [Planctomycetota bacterium]
MQNPLDVFRERGFLAQVSHERELDELFTRERTSVYVGFDPTASSLHVGSLVPILGLMHVVRCGHRPIAIVGGGTARIGDPSGKTEMRQMLTGEAIDENARAIGKILARFLPLEGPPEEGVLLDNASWLLELSYVEFLRDIGRHFSVNRMLAAEAYKQRLERGLSFIEFNYQILQAYDFLKLFEGQNCRVQMGGDDQWGNILAGVDLTRRCAQAEVYGITFPLITTASGAKMGKTERGAIWLDAERTTPYDFFQYWINVDDRDVERFLKMFTFLDLETIAGLCVEGGEALREAKRVLAREVTKLVHGADEAHKAEEGARALREGGGMLEAAPRTEIPRTEVEAGIGVLDLFRRTGLAPSNGAVRRLIQNRGAYLGDSVVEDPTRTISIDDFEADQLLLRAGKKRYHLVVLV